MIKIAKTTGNFFAEAIVKRIINGEGMFSAAGVVEVNLVTSWNRQCGIATYSRFLGSEMKKIS